MSQPYDLNDTVNAARDVMATLVNPDADFHGCWSLPDDIANINMTKLPVFLVMHDLDGAMEWSRHSTGRGRWDWSLEILLYLERGEHDTMIKYSQAITKHGHWLRVVGGHLLKNMDLSVPQTRVGGSGSSSRIYTPYIVHIDWGNHLYWGIRFSVPVVQIFSQETSRSS